MLQDVKRKYISLLIPVLIAISAIAISLLVCNLGTFSLILLSVFIFPLIFFRKEYFLVFLLLFIPLFPKIDLIQVLGTSTTIRIEDFVIALAVVWAYLTMLREQKTMKLGPLSFAMIAYMLISLVSLVAGILQETIEPGWMPILYLVRRLEYFSLIYVGYYLCNENSIGLINKWMLRVFTVVALIAILQKLQLVGGFLHEGYISSIQGRAFATFGAGGELAAYVSIIIVFTFLKIFGANGLKQLLWTAFAAFQLFILSLTASRAEFLSLPVVVGTLAVFKRQSKYVVLFILLLAILFIIVAPKDRFYSLFSTNTLDIIKDIAGGVKTMDISQALRMERQGSIDYELSAVLRATIWVSAIGMFLRYPLFGVGQSAFGDFVDNNYIRILAENGILGLIAFLLMIFYLCRYCIKAYNDAQMPDDVRNYGLFIFLVTVNLLLIGLMVDAFEMSKIAFLFWLMVGVLYRSIGISKEKALYDK